MSTDLANYFGNYSNPSSSWIVCCEYEIWELKCNSEPIHSSDPTVLKFAIYAWTYLFASARSAKSINILKQFQNPNRVNINAPNWHRNLSTCFLLGAAMVHVSHSAVQIQLYFRVQLHRCQSKSSPGLWPRIKSRPLAACLRWTFILKSDVFLE